MTTLKTVDKMDLTNLEFHELANVFPLVDEDQIQQMANDIKKVGLIEPLTLLDGKILDGRNRYNACKLAGRKLHPEDVVQFEEEYENEDPIMYVISRNIHRRHLTVGQRSALGAELFKRMAKDGTTAKQRAKKAGEVTGVAASSVEQAAHIEKAAPELHKELKAGKKTLHKVAKEAAKKLAGADHDEALLRIKQVCGAKFEAAITDDLIDHLKTPKAIVAFAALSDEKMSAVAPVLQLGWTLNRAMSFIDKEVTPATNGQAMVDLFVFKGSKRLEFQLDGVKFVLSKVPKEGNGQTG